LPERLGRLAPIDTAGKDQAVHDPEGLPLGQMPALYVNLMPKDPGSRLPTKLASGTTGPAPSK
jgi:hypothetical protein